MSMFRNLIGMTTQSGRLPKEYQEVEYIGTYTGYQQIDTGIQVQPPQMVKMGIEFKETGDQPVLGEQGSTRKYLMCSSSGWPLPYWQINYNGNWMASTTETTADQYYEYESFLSNGSQYIKIDGSQIYSNTRTGTPSVSTNLVLFNMDNTNWNAKIKLYSCKIYNNAVLVCDLVPCYRKSDNEIGMYDLCSNTFKTNQLSGTFEKGPDII